MIIIIKWCLEYFGAIKVVLKCVHSFYDIHRHWYICETVHKTALLTFYDFFHLTTGNFFSTLHKRTFTLTNHNLFFFLLLIINYFSHLVLLYDMNVWLHQTYEMDCYIPIDALEIKEITHRTDRNPMYYSWLFCCELWIFWQFLPHTITDSNFYYQYNKSQRHK